ncbi:hypothetical protein [Rhodopirellula europaea]|uniref:hypothetical protein n=1 Tax=Rhodopirellula europaea TaxID=1263866 RepID=UPI0036F1F227
MIATEHANGMVKTPASDHRQVQPGLRLSNAVGHVPHGIHADALEQSEECSRPNIPSVW